MSATGGPRITTDNMVMCLDAHDAKSYPGEPTANYFEDLGEVTKGEFGQYRNLVSIFETYGLVPYTMTMEIKGNIDGTCYVYMQNGSYTKYSFVAQSVTLTTEYQRFTFSNLTPAGPTAAWQANTPNDDRAMLATYTGYGSGRNPTVRNIQIEKGSYATPYVKRTGGRPDSVNLMIRGSVGTGTTFYDSSPYKLALTNTNGASHSSVSKFSGNSLKFVRSSSQYLDTASTDACNFGTGDWTIDFWFNMTSGQTDRMHALTAGTYTGCGGGTNIDFNFNDGNAFWLYWNGCGSPNISFGSDGDYGDGAWHHMAVTRDSGMVRVWVDGVHKGSNDYSSSTSMGSTDAIHIGSSGGGVFWDGYLDEIRVVKGTALWSGSSNFTLPTRRSRGGGAAWVNRAMDTSGSSIRNGANFYGGAATKVAHHSNGQVIEPKSAAIIDCDGTDDWIDTGIVLKSTMTFSFWYKSESTTAGRVLNVAAWHASSPNRWFEMLITDGYSSGAKVEIWAYGYNTSRNDFYPGQPDANLNWRNLVISFSNGTGTAYMDGVSLGSDAGAFTDFDGADNHSTFWLGRGRNYHYNNANSYTYKDCQIGQFHAWEKALTAAEVKANFNAHRGRYGI